MRSRIDRIRNGRRADGTAINSTALRKRARGASAETMTSASSSRLDAKYPAEIQKKVEDAVFS